MVRARGASKLNPIAIQAAIARGSCTIGTRADRLLTLASKAEELVRALAIVLARVGMAVVDIVLRMRLTFVTRVAILAITLRGVLAQHSNVLAGATVQAWRRVTHVVCRYLGVASVSAVAGLALARRTAAFVLAITTVVASSVRVDIARLLARALVVVSSAVALVPDVHDS